jgi:hypothetical protein
MGTTPRISNLERHHMQNQTDRHHTRFQRWLLRCGWYNRCWWKLLNLPDQEALLVDELLVFCAIV